MNATYPTARSMRHAFAIIERLPQEALFDLAERLIDRLDARDLDSDFEAEEDHCEAEEPGLQTLCSDRNPGDEDDAEDDGGQEPDEEDEDDTPPSSLRPERDGLVRVWRRACKGGA